MMKLATSTTTVVPITSCRVGNETLSTRPDLSRNSVTKFLKPVHETALLAESWQARRDSNPQPSVLETDALPLELLAFSRKGQVRS